MDKPGGKSDLVVAHLEWKGKFLEELIRTNNQVLISVIIARLEEAGIGYFLADQHASVMDGSIGAIPRRLLVESGDVTAAQRLLDEIQKDASE